MLEERIDNSAEFRSFAADIARGGLSHAYLLLGADTAVRSLYIKKLASLILCPERGCGECPVCQKVYADCHPDIKYYNRDGKCRVDDAVRLIADTYIKGWESAVKLYFVDNAEALMSGVQNKLLKICEEPPQGVTIFLLAGSEGGLLQTILSRAKKLYLPAFTVADVYDDLVEEGYSNKAAETAAALSGGRFDKANLYAKDDAYPKLYDECFETLAGCKSSKDIPSYTGKSIFSKENLPVTLEIMEIILNDILKLVSNGGALRTYRREYQLDEIGKGFSPGGAAMAILALNKARRMLGSYVSPAGVADTVLFEILEAKYKWR